MPKLSAMEAFAAGRADVELATARARMAVDCGLFSEDEREEFLVREIVALMNERIERGELPDSVFGSYQEAT